MTHPDAVAEMKRRGITNADVAIQKEDRLVCTIFEGGRMVDVPIPEGAVFHREGNNVYLDKTAIYSRGGGVSEKHS